MAACWDVLGGPGEAGREMSCVSLVEPGGTACIAPGPRAPKQTRLLGADTMAPLFSVVGRSSSVRRMPWGALPGGRQGHRDALPGTRPQPALSGGERGGKNPNQTKPNQLFRSKSPRKCAKRGTVWKTKAMFHLISVAGESRKCLFFIHPLRVVWLGGGKPGSVRVYVGYCAKRNYEVSQKSSLERCMALNLIKADVTCVPRQVIPTCP